MVFGEAKHFEETEGLQVSALRPNIPKSFGRPFISSLLNLARFHAKEATLNLQLMFCFCVESHQGELGGRGAHGGAGEGTVNISLKAGLESTRRAQQFWFCY